MSRKRVAYLALGRQAQEHRIASGLMLALEGLVEVVAVADTQAGVPERVAHMFAKPGSFGPFHERESERVSYAPIMTEAFPVPHHYPSLEAMVDGEQPRGGIDVLVISAPPHAHKRLAIQAMRLGLKALLLEKPLALTLDDAWEILEVSRQTGCLVAVGYQYGYGVRDETMHWFEQPKVGVVRNMFGHWDRALLIPDNADYHRRDTGVPLDLPGHVVGPMRRILEAADQPVRMEAQGWRDNGVAIYGADQFQAFERIESTVWWQSGVRWTLKFSYADCAPPTYGRTYRFDAEELGFDVQTEFGKVHNPMLARELNADAYPVMFSHREGDRVITEPGPNAVLYTEAVIEQLRDLVLALDEGRELRFTAAHAFDAERIVHALPEALALPPGRVYEIPAWDHRS